ncbi:13988_t:CDS:2, partial [Funneliformis mosseae]
KRYNTLQTTEPESSVFTAKPNDETPVIINIDPFLLNKGKGKEVFTSEINSVSTSDHIVLYLPNT